MRTAMLKLAVMIPIAGIGLWPARIASAQLATTRLVGRWQIDNKKTVELIKKRKVVHELAPYLEVIRVVVQFSENERFSILMEGKEQARGKWRTLREIRQKGASTQLDIEFSSDELHGAKKDHFQARVRYYDNNTIEIDVKNPDRKSPGIVLVFRRK